MCTSRSRGRRAVLRRAVAIAVTCAAFAGGCRSVRVRPGLIRPAYQVAHERRPMPPGQRVPPPNADRAASDGSLPPHLQRHAEVAAAAIVWLLSGGIVGVALDGTFEENALFGGSNPRAPERREEPGAGDEPGRPARKTLPDWLVVPPEP